MNEAPRLLSIADTARLLGISEGMVRKLLRNGQLSAVKIGRSTRIAMAEVDTYAAALPKATFGRSHKPPTPKAPVRLSMRRGLVTD